MFIKTLSVLFLSIGLVSSISLEDCRCVQSKGDISFVGCIKGTKLHIAVPNGNLVTTAIGFHASSTSDGGDFIITDESVHNPRLPFRSFVVDEDELKSMNAAITSQKNATRTINLGDMLFDKKCRGEDNDLIRDLMAFVEDDAPAETQATMFRASVLSKVDHFKNVESHKR